ncbi:MAG TPA: IS1595 family transposase [Blastocatellia bacterium]
MSTARGQLSLFEKLGEFSNEDLCVRHLEQVRWPDGLSCIRDGCNSRRIMRFTAKGKTGKVRHLYECADCRYQYSVTTGTLFHNSHMPLNKWFIAIHMVSGGSPVSARDLQRRLKINYRTALSVVHRIRQAFKQAAGTPVTTQQIRGQRAMTTTRRSA